MEVDRKVALVTGAASGIGLSYVKELLRNNAKGVLMTDINLPVAVKELQELREEFGHSKVFFLKVDVCNTTELEDAFKSAVSIFNQLDIVINNAGVLNEVEWEKSCQINFLATIAGTKLAVEKYLPENKSGDEAVVINTCSMIGYSRAMGSSFRYETSKVRVIGICAGITATNILNVSEDQVPEPFKSRATKAASKMTIQTPDSVTRHVVELIRSASSGSMWKISHDECDQIEFPEYQI